MTHSQPTKTDFSSIKPSYSYNEVISDNEPRQSIKPEELEMGDEEEDDKDTHRSWSPIIKPRRRFSTEEILFLENEFAKDINPSSDYLQMIAETLGTTRRVITTWFQNHRAKGKRAINSTTSQKLSIDSMLYYQPQRKDKGKATDHHTCMNMAEFEICPAPYVSDQASSSMYCHHPAYNSHHEHMPSSSLTLNPSTDYDWDSTTAHWPTLPPSYQLDHSALPHCCLVELYTGSPCPFHSLYSV